MSKQTKTSYDQLLAEYPNAKAMSKQTQAEIAFDEFAREPLVKFAGVDRASFIAGHDTAQEAAPITKQERDELRAVLAKFADLDTADMGNNYATERRNAFLNECPEYKAYCATVRTLLSRIKP